ncbi:hypothetical protein HD554DRAFT_2021912 [Boletus coccyginus]|nr:hypothetical protein HD554DRAFT_2021912 [Boletus coccyginus]
MNFNALPTLSFTPTSVSFPFESKQLSLPNKVRIQLEPQTSVASSTSNGIFPRGSLSLSAPHAEVWIQGKQVLVRDRSSTYGTYINGIRIQQQTLLQDGDIVTLGQQLPGSSAPPNAHSSQLNPIEAFVTIVGV